MRLLLSSFLVASIAGLALGTTFQTAPHEYLVDAGVTFSISNDGANSYLFSWSDDGGSFVDVPDPSFILMTGQTYVFMRTTGAHPLVITDGTLPTSGTDGSYQRTTTDGAVIDAATLTPIADFTADPAPTTDAISWTAGPGDLGNYFYTCRVTGHVGMTGGIRMIEGTVAVDAKSWSATKALFDE